MTEQESPAARMVENLKAAVTDREQEKARAAEEEKLFTVAESIYDGWYADARIDWEDFIDRLEAASNIDFGSDMDSPLIRRVKAHIRKYRKL